MIITQSACSSCGTTIVDGYRNCASCGAPITLGGNSEAGDLHRISATPGRDISKMNANLLDTIPRVLTPQPQSQYSDAWVDLVFIDPFTASSASAYGNDAFGEIGSNNPVSLAYSRRVLHRAIFASPLFDLRPELGASAGNPGAASINRGGAFGQGSRYNVQLKRGRTSTSGERLYNYSTVDFTALSDPQDLVQSSSPQSISATVRNAPILPTDALTTTLLTFSPPANPVRFWTVYVIVDILANAPIADETPAVHKVRWWAG